MPIRSLIAGNWKMNCLRADAAALARGVAERLGSAGGAGCDLLVCPPFPHLQAVAEALTGSAVELGAQDCHMDEAGAHTGDVSAVMLADAGCDFVIVGHSERRANHAESDALVRAKAAAAQAAGLCAIICIGETLDQRDAGETLAIVEGQLKGSLPDGAGSGNTVIAYEPVWAIGTGRTPTIEQIAEVHDHIRSVLQGLAGDGDAVRILYGGSVNPGNAADILAVANVNGGLVGGASLKPDDFWAIAQSASSA